MRRQVRVATSFFEHLDELLPAERTAAGEASAADFLLHEIAPLIDRLAADYEAATIELHGAPGIRVLVTGGALVPYFAVYTALANDGAVTVVYLDIETFGEDPASVSIRISTPFTFVDTGGPVSIDRESTAALAVLLPLHKAEVSEAYAIKDGHLVVRFADGRAIEVSPHDQYEAWQVDGHLPPIVQNQPSRLHQRRSAPLPLQLERFGRIGELRHLPGSCRRWRWSPCSGGRRRSARAGSGGR